MSSRSGMLPKSFIVSYFDIDDSERRCNDERYLHIRKKDFTDKGILIIPPSNKNTPELRGCDRHRSTVVAN